MGTRLLTLSSQLSRCRTVLRLFDDVAMFIYTKQYGLGAEVTGARRLWETRVSWTCLEAVVWAKILLAFVR